MGEARSDRRDAATTSGPVSKHLLYLSGRGIFVVRSHDALSVLKEEIAWPRRV
jgi:hypothetical protein